MLPIATQVDFSPPDRLIGLGMDRGPSTLEGSKVALSSEHARREARIGRILQRNAVHHDSRRRLHINAERLAAKIARRQDVRCILLKPTPARRQIGSIPVFAGRQRHGDRLVDQLAVGRAEQQRYRLAVAKAAHHAGHRHGIAEIDHGVARRDFVDRDARGSGNPAERPE